MLFLQHICGMDPLLSYYSVYLGLGIGMILTILCCYYNIVLGWTLYYLIFCLSRSLYWYDTNDLVLLLQYDSGMDPLFSYFSVYLGLCIGMILMILCYITTI